jgi:hypothetical protein
MYKVKIDEHELNLRDGDILVKRKQNLQYSSSLTILWFTKGQVIDSLRVCTLLINQRILRDLSRKIGFRLNLH